MNTIKVVDFELVKELRRVDKKFIWFTFVGILSYIKVNHRIVTLEKKIAELEAEKEKSKED